MVYNTQSYWIFRLCPSSGILETREHNVSETGSVSILRLGPLTLWSLVFRIPDGGRNPKTQ
jgi:hypothetical protein